MICYVVRKSSGERQEKGRKTKRTRLHLILYLQRYVEKANEKKNTINRLLDTRIEFDVEIRQN